MNTTTMTTARQTPEHLVRAIQRNDLAGLMPADTRDYTRMQQLVELARSCASDLLELLQSFQREGTLFERLEHERVPRMLRKVQIRVALRAVAVQLEQVREVLA